MTTTYTPARKNATTTRRRMRQIRSIRDVSRNGQCLLDRGRELTATAVSEKDIRRMNQHASDSKIRTRIYQAFRWLRNNCTQEESVKFEGLEERFRSCRQIVKFDSETNEAYVQVRSCKMGKVCPYCSRKVSSERRDELAYVLDTATKVTNSSFCYWFVTLTTDDIACSLDPRDGRKKLDFIRKELRKWKNRNRANIKGSVSKIEFTINKETGRIHLHIHLILATELRSHVQELCSDWKHGFTHFRKLTVDTEKTAVEFSSGVASYLNKAIDEGHSVKEIATTIDLAYYKRTRWYAFTGFFSELRANYNDAKRKQKESNNIEIPEPPKAPKEQDLPSGTYNLKMLIEACVAINSKTARWLYETYLYREKYGTRYERSKDNNEKLG